MRTLDSRSKLKQTVAERKATSEKSRLGEQDCIVCGRHTNHVASVYLGKQDVAEDGTSVINWQLYTRALCPDCAAQQVDSHVFGVLVYVALQVCWVPLFTHGLSGLGLGGAAIATWALIGLLRSAAQAIWPRVHPDDGRPTPRWMRSESDEERDSRALREILREKAPDIGFLVETLAEHRRHAK